ncbi:MAG: hypothetical protein IJ538_03475 [Clostridia bacterium]|nr:hypothetical protein [Clostridia bacterium]
MFAEVIDFSLLLKFFWGGLICGLGFIAFDILVKLTRRNLILFNLFSFVYVLIFGGWFAFICLKFNNYSFTWLGLFSMLVGLFLVKISIKFFFDYFEKLLYNKLGNRKRKVNYEQLRSIPQSSKNCDV